MKDGFCSLVRTCASSWRAARSNILRAFLHNNEILFVARQSRKWKQVHPAPFDFLATSRKARTRQDYHNPLAPALVWWRHAKPSEPPQWAPDEAID